MGRREEKQQPLWMNADELPRSPGHRFYEKLNELLRETDFDRKVEALCQRFYASEEKAGRPSIPPGVYFRMLFIGYFEGIESERGLEWRCADSLSLRQFVGLVPTERVPDHTALSRIRTRLDGAVYDEVFRLVLGVVEGKGLLKGTVVGVDSTYLRADASMKAIVRKDTGASYAEYLTKLAQEQGIETPTVEDCRRLDRKRKGKRTSNRDWTSRTDVDARIARLKDGRTRLAYKAEHVVDMETGVVLAATIHAADQGDTATLEPSLQQARDNLAAITSTEVAAPTTDREGIEHDGGKGFVVEGAMAEQETLDASPPNPERTSAKATVQEPEKGEEKSVRSEDDPPKGPPLKARSVIEVVADKGYHKADLLRALGQEQYRTYISVPKKKGIPRWADKGGIVTQQAYADNCTRVAHPKGRALLRRRGELIERSFAHVCETGGHRRVRLRGRENVRKRYLVQVAAMNLGRVLRGVLGRGTPRGLAEVREGLAWLGLVLGAAMAAGGAFVVRIRSALGRCSVVVLRGWWSRLRLAGG